MTSLRTAPPNRPRRRPALAAFCALGLLVGLAASLAPAAARAQTQSVHRFGLFVGKNDGGAERARLRYAVSDASAMAHVLTQLGGISMADALLLEEPELSELERAILAQIERVRRVEASGGRSELVFYYSGHSDSRGLLLGEALVPYGTLKGWLEQVPADVRIVLLDSCSSGTLTRLKGGAHKPPFLFDESVAVRGHAILTASAEDEAAQESDNINGSFFTHYLVSGLRGAADSSADGRVTLTEAYRFAFEETLARTGTTKAGAQHPSYDIQLVGTGDLVMTDLRETQATLELTASVEGHVYIRDHNDRLVAELNKAKGAVVKLGFAPGSYELLLETRGARRGTSVRLTALGVARLADDAFVDVPLELAVARGGERRVVAVGLSLLPPYDTYGRAASVEVESYLGLHALYGETDVLSGFQLALGANGAMSRADGVQLAIAANRAASLRGVQIAGFGNAARTSLVGIQLSGLGNLVRGDALGAQLAFGYNGAAHLRGVQLGGVNVTRAQSYGLFGGALNVAGEAYGAQIGGLNWARDIGGAQAAFVNLAGNVAGVQVGLLNVARGDVRGAQIGMVNYANSTDAGIAPVSITREGGVHAQLLASDVAAFSAELRFDARYTYSFFGAGWHPFGEREQRTYLLGGGFGGKIPLWQMVSLELDAGFHVVQPVLKWQRGVPNMLARTRLLARVELHKHFSLLGGLSFNSSLCFDDERELRPGFDNRRELGTDRGDGVMRYWPGWVVGVRL